ncbi:MAG: hypothetical protein JSR31_08310 [Nitrospira sp.]|nr:hypothetical protein [Nitrospira sp.]
MRLFSETVEQRVLFKGIVGLAWRQDNRQGCSSILGDQMNFCGPFAAGSVDGVRAVLFIPRFHQGEPRRGCRRERAAISIVLSSSRITFRESVDGRSVRGMGKSSSILVGVLSSPLPKTIAKSLPLNAGSWSECQ